MKTILYPGRKEWEKLCKRPAADDPEIDTTVRSILGKVRLQGDNALHDLSLEFDSVSPENMKVLQSEIEDSQNFVSIELKKAISTAKDNIWNFHKSQLATEKEIETMPGVKCRRKNVPIEKVGLYIPGGSAPLFSTVLMLAIPAKIAGCRKIIMCTPPDKQGKIDPLILYTALETSVTDIYKVGGAQAVAAMAYGTESIPRVDKIFGPGNRYVTRAKEMVQAEGISIDMPAGPSEVLVVADKYADPEFVAADLLAQAEHGPDSQVLMLTDNRTLLRSVSEEIKKQVMDLPRKETALKAMENCLLIVMNNLDECIDLSNLYAPEHLIINTKKPDILAEKVINAGSVFIGKYSCESAGDYASGTNHTLPTNGFARSYSGVSAESYVKKITFQELTSTGIENIGKVIELMAEAESLQGHSNAVKIRLNKINNV